MQICGNVGGGTYYEVAGIPWSKHSVIWISLFKNESSSVDEGRTDTGPLTLSQAIRANDVNRVKQALQEGVSQ